MRTGNTVIWNYSPSVGFKMEWKYFYFPVILVSEALIVMEEGVDLKTVNQ